MQIEAKGIIKILTYMENEYVLIKNRIPAVGFRRTKIKRIFDPFFTTKLRRQRTGLGLWDLLFNY